jgi:hypothetical protein
MKKCFLLLAGLVTLVLGAPPASAVPSLNLDFLFKDSAAPAKNSPDFSVPVAPAKRLSPQAPSDRLAIPSEAIEAPLGSSGTESQLPPPPTEFAESPNPAPDSSPSFEPFQPAPSVSKVEKTAPVAKPVELTFDLPAPGTANPLVQQTPMQRVQPAPVQPVPVQPTPVQPVQPVPQPLQQRENYTLDDLFAGNSDSLVAVAVGSAEGTRTPEGDRNPGYYGHTDPGNGVWNLGTFSYQHDADSPEAADAKQLNRLQDQAQVMQAKAAAQGLTLTLEETLNGIDLANQAPKAVLDQDGYVDWLAKAHQKGLDGTDAILWARTQSFIDPKTQQWNAPGLDNDADRISRDQERRMMAIADAISTYKQDVASQSRKKFGNQAVHLLLSEEHGIARLFAQKVKGLFEHHSPEPSAQAQPAHTSSVVQQILNLDLSSP